MERPRLPEWLRNVNIHQAGTHPTRRLLRRHGLNTVCEEARCPNRGECFARRTAAFLILGDTCSRACRFCAVGHGRLAPPDPDEPRAVAALAAELGLRHVVVTSVTRDDLPDGGAGQFAATIRAVRGAIPGATVEVLVPDFQGDPEALRIVLEADPDVFNHNVETVPRLYPQVRPQADYARSLAVLRLAAEVRPGRAVKSGLMVGLGEERDEILAVLGDLRAAGCILVTIGQYLQPRRDNLPVVRYVHPTEFERYETDGLALGFAAVFAGPLVRSSYAAEELLRGLPSAGIKAAKRRSGETAI
jgi:lipoic acid synthetase